MSRIKVPVMSFYFALQVCCADNPGHLRANCHRERKVQPQNFPGDFEGFNQCLIQPCLSEDSSDVTVGAESVTWNWVCWKTFALAVMILNAAHAAGCGLMEHLWVSKIDRKCACHVSKMYSYRSNHRPWEEAQQLHFNWLIAAVHMHFNNIHNSCSCPINCYY